MTQYRYRSIPRALSPDKGAEKAKAADKVMSCEAQLSWHDNKGLTGNNGEARKGGRPHRENQQHTVTLPDLDNRRK